MCIACLYVCILYVLYYICIIYIYTYKYIYIYIYIMKGLARADAGGETVVVEVLPVACQKL